MVLKALGDAAIEHGVVKSGGWMINGGDLFNEKGMIRTRVWDVLVHHRGRWKEDGIEHIDLIGNHDQDDRDGVIHPLKIFAKWEGWDVVDAPRYVPEKRWWLFPYMHDLGKQLDDIKKRKMTTVFCHVGIQGAWRNDTNKDTDGIALDRFKGFARVFTGHYHFRHMIGNIQYIGSPMQQSAAEKGQAKGYLIWDDEAERAHFHEIPGTPRYFDGEMSWPADTEAFYCPPEVGERDYVTITVKGPAAKVRAVTRDMLQQRTKCRNVKIERVIDDATYSRLNIKHDEALDTEALVKKYVGFVNPSALDHKRLLKVGQELLT